MIRSGCCCPAGTPAAACAQELGVTAGCEDRPCRRRQAVGAGLPQRHKDRGAAPWRGWPASAANGVCGRAGAACLRPRLAPSPMLCCAQRNRLTRNSRQSQRVQTAPCRGGWTRWPAPTAFRVVQCMGCSAQHRHGGGQQGAPQSQATRACESASNGAAGDRAEAERCSAPPPPAGSNRAAQRSTGMRRHNALPGEQPARAVGCGWQPGKEPARRPFLPAWLPLTVYSPASGLGAASCGLLFSSTCGAALVAWK